MISFKANCGQHTIDNARLTTDAGPERSLQHNPKNADETARYEPSYLDLNCLQMYLFWSAGLTVLKANMKLQKTAFLGFFKKEEEEKKDATKCQAYLIPLASIPLKAFHSVFGA